MNIPREYSMRYTKWHHVHTPFPPELIELQTRLLCAWPQLWLFFRWIMYTFGYIYSGCQGVDYDYWFYHRREIRQLRGYYQWLTESGSWRFWQKNLTAIPRVHYWIIPESIRLEIEARQWQ